MTRRIKKIGAGLALAGFLLTGGLAGIGYAQARASTTTGVVTIRSVIRGVLTFVNGATAAITSAAIGTTSTDGLVLQNTTAATGGVTVQYSPRLKWCGTAWNSTAGTSETDCWVVEVQPATVAGTTNASLVLKPSIAGGAYGSGAILTSAGNWRIAGSVLGFLSSSEIRNASDGVIGLFNSAGTDFSRLQFGGTTSSFPSLKRSSTTLAVRLGDDSADASLTAANITASGKFALGTVPTVTVDGATTFAVTTSYVILACTGAETINTITGGVAGMVVWIENSDTECTIADDDAATAANAIDLTGSANDVGAVAKVIGLIYTGASWMQIFESDN